MRTSTINNNSARGSRKIGQDNPSCPVQFSSGIQKRCFAASNAFRDARKEKMNTGNVTEEQARVAQKSLNRHNKLNSYGKGRTNHLNTVYRAPGCSIINESKRVRAGYLIMSTVRSYPPKDCEHYHSPAYHRPGLPFADHRLTGDHFARSC